MGPLRELPRPVPETSCQIPHGLLRKSTPHLPAGDAVFFDGMVFEAKETHEASPQFSDDLEDHWMFIPFPNERQAKTAQLWKQACWRSPVHPGAAHSAKRANGQRP